MLILSNEAMASQWKHSLISCVYLRNGRPNCTLNAVVSHSGQNRSSDLTWLLQFVFVVSGPVCLPSHQFVSSQSVCVCVRVKS